MNLKEVRDTYYEFSGKTSDLVRTLALSALAVIWVFKMDSGIGPTLARPLIVAGLLAVASLGADLLHYVVATLVWGTLSRFKEKQAVADEADFVAPRWLNWPALTLFVLKVVFLVAAYGVLLFHLYRSLG